jgi:hypothetical protein
MEWIGHAPQPRPELSHPGLKNCLSRYRRRSFRAGDQMDGIRMSDPSTCNSGYERRSKIAVSVNDQSTAGLEHHSELVRAFRRCAADDPLELILPLATIAAAIRISYKGR